MIGRVALVGAGPGDPRLLTVRAVELLREADVVAYDELVSQEILGLAPKGAEASLVSTELKSAQQAAKAPAGSAPTTTG